MNPQSTIHFKLLVSSKCQGCQKLLEYWEYCYPEREGRFSAASPFIPASTGIAQLVQIHFSPAYSLIYVFFQAICRSTIITVQEAMSDQRAYWDAVCTRQSKLPLLSLIHMLPNGAVKTYLRHWADCLLQQVWTEWEFSESLTLNAASKGRNARKTCFFLASFLLSAEVVTSLCFEERTVLSHIHLDCYTQKCKCYLLLSILDPL